MNSKEHAAYIADRVREETHKKYLQGAEINGGYLPRKACLPHAREEALDLNVYLITLEDQITDAVSELYEAMNYLADMSRGGMDVKNPAIHIQQAIDILTVGNAEGIVEEERSDEPGDETAP